MQEWLCGGEGSNTAKHYEKNNKNDRATTGSTLQSVNILLSRRGNKSPRLHGQNGAWICCTLWTKNGGCWCWAFSTGLGSKRVSSRRAPREIGGGTPCRRRRTRGFPGNVQRDKTGVELWLLSVGSAFANNAVLPLGQRRRCRRTDES